MIDEELRQKFEELAEMARNKDTHFILVVTDKDGSMNSVYGETDRIAAAFISAAKELEDIAELLGTTSRYAFKFLKYVKLGEK